MLEYNSTINNKNQRRGDENEGGPLTQKDTNK